MRLFIAVDLSDKMKTALIGTMHELKQQGITGNYVPKQNLHMTLAFIGETKEIDLVKKVMDSLPVEKGRLSFSGYTYFGDILVAGIKGNQKIKKYAADLRKALKDNGLPCDMTKFEPHVTLIRKTKGRHPQNLPVPDADMTITKVSLMKSETQNGKQVYKEIYSITAS